MPLPETGTTNFSVTLPLMPQLPSRFVEAASPPMVINVLVRRPAPLARSHSMKFTITKNGKRKNAQRKDRIPASLPNGIHSVPLSGCTSLPQRSRKEQPIQPPGCPTVTLPQRLVSRHRSRPMMAPGLRHRPSQPPTEGTLLHQVRRNPSH